MQLGDNGNAPLSLLVFNPLVPFRDDPEAGSRQGSAGEDGKTEKLLCLVVDSISHRYILLTNVRTK